MDVSLFALAKSYSPKNLIPSNMVGIIDFGDSKNFRLNLIQNDISQLTTTLVDHALVYHYPFVYVIGGRSKEKWNSKCYAFNVIKNTFQDIASISNKDQICNPASIVVNGSIYIFNVN